MQPARRFNERTVGLALCKSSKVSHGPRITLGARLVDAVAERLALGCNVDAVRILMLTSKTLTVDDATKWVDHASSPMYNPQVWAQLSTLTCTFSIKITETGSSSLFVVLVRVVYGSSIWLQAAQMRKCNRQACCSTECYALSCPNLRITTCYLNG